MIVMALVAALAAGARYVAPHSPTALDPVAFQAAPSETHPLGTDSVGGDVLRRLIYAARVSLTVGVCAVSIYVLIGTAVGAVAGYYGGAVDLILSRMMDVMLSFPPLIIILFAVSIFGRPSLWNVIIVLGLLGWPALARLVRGQFLGLRGLEFVRPPRPRDGGERYARGAATCAAERAGPSAGGGHLRGRQRDPHRGRAVIPR